MHVTQSTLNEVVGIARNVIDVDAKDIEDSSWVRVRDKDIFSRRVTERPSDEGARSARNVPGKDTLFRTRRLEEFYIFQLEVDCDTLSS